jgi:3-oxoacyl-[acyl-carrier-protein] synthase III
MNVMNEVYITGTGAFLPGDPVDNEQLAARFGGDTRRSAALRRRTLAANGITTRHYAVDEAGRTLMLNEELAAEAARRALKDRGLSAEQASMLTAGTTQGDLLVPGFASMVHGRLGGGPMELLSAAGVCASGMAALKAAVSAVRLGEHPVAVAVGSELVSRSFGADEAGSRETPDTSAITARNTSARRCSTGCATPGTPWRTSAGSPTCTRRATPARPASSSCSTRHASASGPVTGCC